MPAANWQWSIGPWAPGVSAIESLVNESGPQASLTSATARNLKLKLLDPSEATFTINGRSPEGLIVEELITDLWAYRNGQCLFRGRVQPLADDIDASGPHTLAVTCTDYRGVIERRMRWIDRTWTNVEQSTIVWDAIVDMQAETGGSYGITKGTWPTTGIVRPSVVFKAGDFVWPFVKRLGAMDSGFEFDIDADLKAHLYYPRRGKASGTGAALDLGGAVAKVNRRSDPSRYANGIRQSGAEGVAPYFTTISDLGQDIATAREGRWEAAFADPQLETADMVVQTGKANLVQASQLIPTYTLTLRKGAWGGPDHVWLGDYVTVPVRSGRLNEQPVARVYELDITLDASNSETVQVIAGDIRIDQRSVLRGIAKRVQVLSKE